MKRHTQIAAIFIGLTYLLAVSQAQMYMSAGTTSGALRIEETGSNTYTLKSLTGDVIEIGGEKPSTPRPYLKLNRWGRESSLEVEFPIPEQAESSLSGNKLKWSSDKLDVVVYPVEPVEIEEEGHRFTQNEFGGVEFDTILRKKPETNKIVFPIETRGLKFYYQPPLTQEEKEAGDFRPENVVGSYAVYHESKTRGKYRTGKAFHIYRPKIYDAEGNEIWGELNIDEKAGTLTITIDQDWLDKAAYPVTVDPTFGYTTAGGSKNGLTQIMRKGVELGGKEI
jgi:hypothetical protein